MNTKVQLIILAGLLLAGYGTALECWQCSSSSSGEGNGNDCSEEDPKTKEMSRVISHDDDVCYVCTKITYKDADADKQTDRSCASKSSYESYDAKIDECKTATYAGDDSANICVCQSDKCNGSENMAISWLTILLAASIKHFW